MKLRLYLAVVAVTAAVGARSQVNSTIPAPNPGSLASPEIVVTHLQLDPLGALYVSGTVADVSNVSDPVTAPYFWLLTGSGSSGFAHTTESESHYKQVGGHFATSRNPGRSFDQATGGSNEFGACSGSASQGLVGWLNLWDSVGNVKQDRVALQIPGSENFLATPSPTIAWITTDAVASQHSYVATHGRVVAGDKYGNLYVTALGYTGLSLSGTTSLFSYQVSGGSFGPPTAANFTVASGNLDATASIVKTYTVSSVEKNYLVVAGWANVSGSQVIKLYAYDLGSSHALTSNQSASWIVNLHYTGGTGRFTAQDKPLFLAADNGSDGTSPYIYVAGQYTNANGDVGAELFKVDVSSGSQSWQWGSAMSAEGGIPSVNGLAVDSGVSGDAGHATLLTTQFFGLETSYNTAHTYFFDSSGSLGASVDYPTSPTSGNATGSAICSDSSGHVFVETEGPSTDSHVIGYARGGTTTPAYDQSFSGAGLGSYTNQAGMVCYNQTNPVTAISDGANIYITEWPTF